MGPFLHRAKGQKWRWFESKADFGNKQHLITAAICTSSVCFSLLLDLMWMLMRLLRRLWKLWPWNVLPCLCVVSFLVFVCVASVTFSKRPKENWWKVMKTKFSSSTRKLYTQWFPFLETREKHDNFSDFRQLQKTPSHWHLKNYPFFVTSVAIWHLFFAMDLFSISISIPWVFFSGIEEKLSVLRNRETTSQHQI